MFNSVVTSYLWEEGMWYRIAKFCFALTLICAGGVPAWAVEPNFVGSWNVTFFLEPGKVTGATQCIVITLVPGTVAGLPVSGTWSSPTFPGWHGQWVELGDHVRWFGVVRGLSTEESGNVINSVLTGGVSFNHFLSSSGATSSAGSWGGVKVTACRLGATQLGSDDPAR
jgi:hypothetical protein